MKEELIKEKYKVFCASTGREGLEDFKNNKFNIVIVDIMMPEMDGFELCKNIRYIDEKIPIIILSARNEDIDKVKSLKIGADDYITKPFSIIEFMARVESHLRRYNRDNINKVSKNVLKFNKGLIINLDKRQILLYDKEIKLTEKEYKLFFLMAQNANKVFTKSELYQHVWNSIELDGNNTVSVHIKDLREKLGDNVKKPNFIETIWGVGLHHLSHIKTLHSLYHNLLSYCLLSQDVSHISPYI